MTGRRIAAIAVIGVASLLFLSLAQGLARWAMGPDHEGAAAPARPAPAGDGEDAPANAAPAAPGPCAASAEAPHQWNDEQVANAATIVAVGADLGVPPRGWVIAVATAMQESTLHNYGHLGSRNDHDSLGLFQQRPSQGWGTPGQVTDPTYAATKFYSKLLTISGWQGMRLAEAAQAVQRSAFPEAYQKWESDATALVARTRCRFPARLTSTRTGPTHPERGTP